MITREGVKPFPPTGYRTLDARSAFFYGVTGITPAMAMRLPGIGSQYLFAMRRFEQGVFRRRKTYKVTLPKGIPGGELLVVHALRQPDALDARHAAALSARRQPELSVARRRSRAPTARRPSTSGRRKPAGVKRGNWIQTIPAKAGSRSCASTARSSRSSTSRGGRAEIELVK